MSTKEKYIYDRREWRVVRLAIFIIVSAFVTYSTYAERSGEWGTRVIAAMIFAIGVIYIANYSCLRICITESGIKLNRGFFFARRMFYYYDISKVVFGKIDILNTEKLKELDFTLFHRPDKFVGHNSGVMFTIFLKGGLYYYAWSKDADEMIRVLKKIDCIAMPKIEMRAM